jgi:hypothetical protein
VTGEVQAGVAAWRGNLYFQAAPLAFSTQNETFALAGNGLSGTEAAADARFPLNIDAPQRFGSTRYQRFDPGASILSYDIPIAHLTGALTSASQRWGPARDYPLVLGPNAGGFPSLYLGTSTPVNLWLFKIHGRVVYGALSQSALAAPVDGQRWRIGSGVVGTILPRGVPGLEIGGTRFIHRPWEGTIVSLQTLRRPFSGGLNLSGIAQNEELENQVASVFARWALPAAKVEFYTELYREDFPGHFHQSLSLIEKPDDLMSYTFGFQHVLMARDRRVQVVRAEVVNGETSHQERGERGFNTPQPSYIHGVVTQGHTLNGLILGSPEAYGGAGWRIGFDDYIPEGRHSISLERTLRFDWLPTEVVGTRIRPDEVYALRAEAIRFHKGADYGITLIPALNLNRNLVALHDVWNIALAVSARGWP